MSFPDANDPRFKQRPAIMAIGDSVYNGTQSLTTGPGLPALSPPAQVAKALGLSMVLPNYPRDVLINLRQFLIDNKLNYKALLPDLLKNAEAWRAGAPVFAPSVVAHDNVSIACSTIEDLYTRTAGHEVRKIDGLIERIRNNEDYQAIADLYYAINASFVLNPSGNPDLADMTQIDWVRLRKPKYLLVNIGVNDGLFMALLTGDLAAYRSLISGIPDKIRRLAPWLRDAITATEGICFNSLIKPRAVGNLSPIEDPHNPHINNDYFYSYKSALYSPGPTMARQDMEDLDILVREVNRKVRDILVQALGNNQKLHFVDVYNAAAMYDFKHGTSGRRVDVTYKGKPIHISNLVFSTVGSAYKQGGFFSLDNLHPTSVGYAVLANAVLADMVPAAAGRTPPMVDFQAALDADPLFNNPPPNLEGLSCFFNLVMAIVGAFGLATV